MRIIRFRDASGVARYAEQMPDGANLLLEGDLLAGLQRTYQYAPDAPLLAPLEPTNILCIGLNYREHAAESGAPIPEHPVLFMKPNGAAIGPGQPIRIPACARAEGEVDYECELAVVIGRPARNVSQADALNYVLGYTAANDVSARVWQKEGGGGQFVRGKGFDTFCPLGPAIVTTDEIPDPQTLTIRTRLNGKVMQEESTGDMIFTVAQLISELSKDCTLKPGTVILTGTPQGVGFARKPPVWLQPGDEVSIEIDKIGTLTNPVAAAE